MDCLKSMQIAASGLRAQTGRMQVIAENVANADSTAQRPGGDPYRRKIPTFRSEVDRALEANTAAMGKVRQDPTGFRTKSEPGRPAADQNGYAKNPTAQSVIRRKPLARAQRS